MRPTPAGMGYGGCPPISSIDLTPAFSIREMRPRLSRTGKQRSFIDESRVKLDGRGSAGNESPHVFGCEDSATRYHR